MKICVLAMMLLSALVLPAQTSKQPSYGSATLQTVSSRHRAHRHRAHHAKRHRAHRTGPTA